MFFLNVSYPCHLGLGSNLHHQQESLFSLYLGFIAIKHPVK